VGERYAAGRFTALTVGTIASMIVLALAVLFANSYSTGEVANNARALHSTNSLLGSSAILRAANNQAALFARDVEVGAASAAARDVAIAEARRGLETFRLIVDDVDPALVVNGSDLQKHLMGLVVSSELALEAAAGGDHAAAFEILETMYEPSWEEVRGELRAIQAGTIVNIEETESLAGWIGGATRFLAILLLPAIAIVIYRRIVSTQVRERRLEFEAKLEYERKLSASKDDLLAGVSHQLRTPLTGIYGMADILADDNDVDKQTVHEFVGAIRTEAQELDRMLADILAASRLDASSITFKNESILVTNVVSRAVEPLRKSGVDVDVDVDDSVLVTADAERVIHILRNLVTNAHKHGGPQLKVEACGGEAEVDIVVSDGGDETLASSALFADFANGGVGALTSGSVGLGLSVARRLARGMGGDVRYERQGGRNRFVVRLPKADIRVVAEPLVATRSV
jgi:K+-sensing histidine kinase KdpD